MHDYISLLRGINVGGRIVKMADLKNCYEAAGFTNIKTFLQSGNVTFMTDINNPRTLENVLEEAVTKRFNYMAKIFVISADDLKLILSNYPYDTSDDNYQYYIIFMRLDIAEQLYRAGREVESNIDKLALGDNVIYWKVKKGSTVDSPFSKLLVKTAFREFHTNRNIKTLAKLVA